MSAPSQITRAPEAAMRPPGARLRPGDHLYRAATAHVVGHIRKQSADRVAREIFGGEDRVTGLLVQRAAVNPATMGTSTWAGALAVAAVSDAIVNLAPASAAA